VTEECGSNLCLITNFPVWGVYFHQCSTLKQATTTLLQIVTYSPFIIIQLFCRRYTSYRLSHNYGIISTRLCSAAVRLPLRYGSTRLDRRKVRLCCMSSKNIHCRYCITFHKSLEHGNALCFETFNASIPAISCGVNLPEISREHVMKPSSFVTFEEYSPLLPPRKR
jgi:hypothetical protein